MSMRSIVLFLWCMLVGLQSCGQSVQQQLHCELYEAYVDDRVADWLGIIGRMEALQDTTAAWQRELFLARYGYIGYLLGNERKDEARDELQRTIHALRAVQARFPNEAAFYCLNACFYSYQISLSMVQAPILYPAHQAAMRKAERLSDTEPLLAFEQANMFFYKPRFLGGNQQKAIQKYQQCLSQLNPEHSGSCGWFKLMVQLFLLKAYHETSQQDEFNRLKTELVQRHGPLNWVDGFLNSNVLDE